MWLYAWFYIRYVDPIILLCRLLNTRKQAQINTNLHMHLNITTKGNSMFVYCLVIKGAHHGGRYVSFGYQGSKNKFQSCKISNIWIYCKIQKILSCIHWVLTNIYSDKSILYSFINCFFLRKYLSDPRNITRLCCQSSNQ